MLAKYVLVKTGKASRMCRNVIPSLTGTPYWPLYIPASPLRSLQRTTYVKNSVVFMILAKFIIIIVEIIHLTKLYYIVSQFISTIAFYFNL